MSHSHYCRHCDTTWTCQCISLSDYDTGTKHWCPEAQKRRFMLRKLMSGKDSGCEQGTQHDKPCLHDHWVNG